MADKFHIELLKDDIYIMEQMEEEHPSEDLEKDIRISKKELKKEEKEEKENEQN